MMGNVVPSCRLVQVLNVGKDLYLCIRAYLSSRASHPMPLSFLLIYPLGKKVSKRQRHRMIDRGALHYFK